MTQMIIDSTTAAKLLDVRERIELRDEAGRIIGHFLPGPPRDENGRIISPITDEEAMRILQEQRDKARSWADIKRDLEAM
jgi:hypothetical protein